MQGRLTLPGIRSPLTPGPRPILRVQPPVTECPISLKYWPHGQNGTQVIVKRIQWVTRAHVGKYCRGASSQ